MRVVVLFGAVVALAAACSSDSPPHASLSEGCYINSDCNSPLVCAFKRCHQACTTSRDCEPKQRCMASDRPFHVCQLEDERECSFNSQCPSGQVCGVDGQCRDQCQGERDCLQGQVCVQGTCAEEEELSDAGSLPFVQADAEAGAPGIPCRYNSDCPTNLVCRNKICAAECVTKADCGPGNDCVDSRCVSGSGAFVGPAGGTVSAAGGKLKLTIPANALRSDVSIVVAPLEAWPAGALGSAYQILPTGLVFDVPAELTIAYDAAEVGNVAVDQIKIGNAVGSLWIPLDSSVDQANHVVTANLAHFSTYGLIGPDPTATDRPDASAGGEGGTTAQDASKPQAEAGLE